MRGKLAIIGVVCFIVGGTLGGVMTFLPLNNRVSWMYITLNLRMISCGM